MTSGVMVETQERVGVCGSCGITRLRQTQSFSMEEGVGCAGARTVCNEVRGGRPLRNPPDVPFSPRWTFLVWHSLVASIIEQLSWPTSVYHRRARVS